MNKYSALILAAGRGSRMGKATEHSHKCLTILQGKTLLEWQLNSLRIAGIEDITVVRGYKAEMLQGNFKTEENPRWADTNMVSTLFCTQPSPNDTIVSYSDIVYAPTHVIQLLKTEGDIVITADTQWYKLWSERNENPLEDAETFKSENGRLTEIGKKTVNLDDIQAQYMGLLKFTPQGWKIAHDYFDKLPTIKQDKLDMTSLLSALMASTEINIAFVEGAWCEVDTYQDKELYETMLNKDKKWHHDWR